MGFIIIGAILLIVGIILYIIYSKTSFFNEGLLAISLTGIVLGGILTIALLITVPLVQMTSEPTLVQYEQEYNDIVTALSQSEENNLSEAGKNILVNRAISYNKNLALQKTRRENFWIGVFTPKIYEDLPLIDLEEFT